MQATTHALASTISASATQPSPNIPGGKTNDECLDPRLYASRAFSKGHVVLDAKSMPDEDIIPVSRDPSCKLDPRRGLIALRNMAEGDIVCVEGDEEGEFEEYELDTETGEMVRV
jgi:hypothetical protein